MTLAMETCQLRTSDDDIVDEFVQWIRSSKFPCVGAKAALNREQMRFALEPDLRLPPTETTLRQLQCFSERYHAEAPLFQSFVVLFRSPGSMTEPEFEQYLWQYLQALHDMDRTQYGWDSSVSRDPRSPDFSFSIGGKAYYVVGLHANASRSARGFPWPALVFNLHDQFERLRADGRYTTIRDTIMKRDEKTDGSRNPMLAKFGTTSEARQYSGRAVEDQWECPFHAR